MSQQELWKPPAMPKRVDVTLYEEQELPSKCLRCGASPAKWVDFVDVRHEWQASFSASTFRCETCAPSCACCGSFVHIERPTEQITNEISLGGDYPEDVNDVPF